MTAATSLLSYSDCVKLMEKAHSYKEGIRVKFADEGAAMNFRMRIHKARALDREANAQIYDEDHKLHGRSRYDDLFCTIRQDKGQWYLYLERRNADTLEIEPLGGENEQQEPTDRDGGEVQGEAGEGGDQSQSEVEELFAPEESEGINRRF